MSTIACIAVAWFCPTSVQAPQGETAEARWRREYPAAVARFEKAARSCVVEGTYTFRYFNGDLSTVEGLKVACSGDKRVVIRDPRKFQRKTPPNPIVFPDVQCYTPESAFILKRDSPARPYKIERFLPRSNGDDASFNSDFYPVVNNATMFWQQSLSTFMSSSTCTVQSVSEVAEAGSELIRVDYEDEQADVTQVGSVWLEPKRGWAIRKVHVVATNHKDHLPVTFTSEVEYRDLPDGSPFPQHMESFTKLPNSGAFEHAIVDLKKIEVGDVPAEMFKLTGYGLPDIPLRPAPRESAFTLRNPLLWVSFVMALISFALLWFIRRKRTASAV